MDGERGLLVDASRSPRRLPCLRTDPLFHLGDFRSARRSEAFRADGKWLLWRLIRHEVATACAARDESHRHSLQPGVPRIGKLSNFPTRAAGRLVSRLTAGTCRTPLLASVTMLT